MQIDYNLSMNTDEAIKKLREIKSLKVETESLKNSNDFARGLNTFKNIIVGSMVDLVKIMLSHEPKVTVLNFPKHEMKMEGHKMTVDLKKTNEILNKISSKGESISTTVQSFATGQMVRSLNLNNTIEKLLKAVKEIKLDPKIEVKSPEVKIPAFPKKIEVSNLDFTQMVDKLEELLTELQYQGKQSVVVANPGDFPVSLPVPSFRDINGATTQVTLTADGLLPVSVDSDNPLAKYRISDRDNAAFPKYYGSVDETGAWYILKEEANSFRYCAGTTAYTTNWANRASLVYDIYSTIF